MDGRTHSLRLLGFIPTEQTPRNEAPVFVLSYITVNERVCLCREGVFVGLIYVVHAV